jgi:hypothetical protein
MMTLEMHFLPIPNFYHRTCTGAWYKSKTDLRRADMLATRNAVTQSEISAQKHEDFHVSPKREFKRCTERKR